MINLYKDVYVTFRKITKKTSSKGNKKPTAIKLGTEQGRSSNSIRRPK